MCNTPLRGLLMPTFNHFKLFHPLIPRDLTPTTLLLRLVMFVTMQKKLLNVFFFIANILGEFDSIVEGKC